MKPVRPPGLDESSDDAINQVLAAEQQAREAQARAHEVATARVSAARLAARRIEQRADERISKLRAACQRWAAERSEELNQQAQALRSAPAKDEARHTRLPQAVARLVEELAGGKE